MLIAGEQIQRFEVLGLLGTGGMGSVFRAHDPQLQREVAIKLLARPAGSAPAGLSVHATIDLRTDAPATTDDLLREARMMARLSHPNVLPVYECGLHGDTVFVVMEYVEGTNLRAWLAEPRTPAAIFEMFVQAGHGLAAAHASQIIHRDFKPENVLVGRDGRVRVADFGLSQLAVRPTRAMQRIVDGYGTPRYMAPELWAGHAATKQSDVFAFCVALAEAFGAERDHELDRILRERGLPQQLREVIAAGLAEDPQVRPELAAVIDAIGGRAPVRRRWPLFAIGIAALGTATTVVLALTGGSAPIASCDGDPGLAAGHWDPAGRARLEQALAPAAPTSWSTETIARIVSTFDETQHAIDDHWRATCVARRDQTLTDAQAAIRRSCLERREDELAARVHQLSTSPAMALGAKLDYARVASIDDCLEMTAPPRHADRTAVAALYQRMIDLDAQHPGAALVAPLEALAKEAAALGERDLEARAILLTGISQRESDQVKAADETMQRAYRIFLDIHSTRYQAVVLVQRSRNANQLGDTREAISLGKLALELVEREGTAAATRVRVYDDLARAALERGDTTYALETTEKGLALVAEDHHRLPTLEASLRMNRARALGSMEGKQDATIAACREAAEWTRTALGAHSQSYATALNLLSQALRMRGDPAAALTIAKQALEVTIESTPPGSASIAMARGDYASILEDNGQFEEARAEFARELAMSEHNEAIRTYLPLITQRLGALTCKVGRCDEGLPMIEHAIELGTAQYGPDHRYTQQYRRELLGLQLSLRKVDDAERTIAALDRSYRARHGAADRSLALLHGLSEAELERLRGHPRKAEALARTALTTWSEIHGDEPSRAALLATLGGALLDQRRWTEARTAFTAALAILQSTGESKDALAQLEIDLAFAEDALGMHDEARARARRARDVLAAYPLATAARERADQILAPPKKRR